MADLQVPSVNSTDSSSLSPSTSSISTSLITSKSSNTSPLTTTSTTSKDASSIGTTTTSIRSLDSSVPFPRTSSRLTSPTATDSISTSSSNLSAFLSTTSNPPTSFIVSSSKFDQISTILSSIPPTFIDSSQPSDTTQTSFAESDSSTLSSSVQTDPISSDTSETIFSSSSFSISSESSNTDQSTITSSASPSQSPSESPSPSAIPSLTSFPTSSSLEISSTKSESIIHVTQTVFITTSHNPQGVPVYTSTYTKWIAGNQVFTTDPGPIITGPAGGKTVSTFGQGSRVAVAVAIPVGTVALVGLLASIFLMRRKKKQKYPTKGTVEYDEEGKGDSSTDETSRRDSKKTYEDNESMLDYCYPATDQEVVEPVENQVVTHSRTPSFAHGRRSSVATSSHYSPTSPVVGMNGNQSQGF